MYICALFVYICAKSENYHKGTTQTNFMSMKQYYSNFLSWLYRSRCLSSLLLLVIVVFSLFYSPVSARAEVDYLCFTAVEAGAVIKINRGNSPKQDLKIDKSTDNGLTWTSVTVSAGTSGTIITTLANVGDKLLLRGKNNTAKGIGSTQESGTNKFYKFEISKNVAVSGDLMSLIDYENEVTTIPNIYCFVRLFEKCTCLVSAENLKLSAIELKNGCYEGMFDGCSNLITPPSILPATELKDNCYNQMFQGCNKMTSTPTLPATTLAEQCYYKMFNNCKVLTSAPLLPVTTLASGCYNYMFGGCIALTTAPELPATTLAQSCYINMFSGCTAITTAPELPATALATSCYSGMFNGCTALVKAPSRLPATTLVQSCYKEMFKGCTALVNAPVIMATSLPSNSTSNAGCLNSMFYNCSALRYVEVHFSAWNGTNNNRNDATDYWLYGTSKLSACKFICPCELPDANRGEHRIQTNWTLTTINKYNFDVATTEGTWDGTVDDIRTLERIDGVKTITALPTAQKEGYTFIGWNTSTDGTGSTLTLSNQTDYTCSHTFYAQFAAQVTFKVNGGTWDGSDADDRVETLPVGSVSDPVRDGYNFTGWNTAPDGTGSGFDIDNQPSTPTTYYAQWELIVPATLELYDNTDNTALLTDNDGNTLDVHFMNRTLVGGTLNTLCLPFSLTEEKLAISPLAGSTLYTFSSATIDGDMLTVEMAETNAITAGVPYLIRPMASIENPVFEGVTISTATGSSCGDSEVRFMGVMLPTLLEAGRQDQLFLTAGNMLQRPSVSNYMRGFRAYFLLNDGPALVTPRARIAFGGNTIGTTTDIEETADNKADQKKIMIDGTLYIIRGGERYTASGIKTE